jgi:hypothetical protein
LTSHGSVAYSAHAEANRAQAAPGNEGETHVSATQTQSISILRAEITTLDGQIKAMEKAHAGSWEDEERLEAAEAEWGALCDNLLALDPETDGDLAAMGATLQEILLAIYYGDRDKADKHETATLRFADAVIRRHAAA